MEMSLPIHQTIMSIVDIVKTYTGTIYYNTFYLTDKVWNEFIITKVGDALGICRWDLSPPLCSLRVLFAPTSLDSHKDHRRCLSDFEL